MFSKLLIIFFTLLQNQEVTYTVAEEMARQQKTNNLSQLITLLSISLITIILLLIINLYKNQKLGSKIRKLESGIK